MTFDKNKFVPLEFYNLLMHDDLLMLNWEIFFEQTVTLSFISAVQIRFLFWAIYFLLKELRRETI